MRKADWAHWVGSLPLRCASDFGGCNSPRQPDGVAAAVGEDGVQAVPEFLAGPGVEPARGVRVVGEVGGGEVGGDPDLARGGVAVDDDLRAFLELDREDAVGEIDVEV